MRSPRPASRFTSLLTTAVLVVAALTAVAIQDSPRSARALASPVTGTAGLFVSTQGRVLDTRNGTGGYSAPLPGGVWQTVQLAGQAGVPTSGVSAVLLSVTAVNESGTGVAVAEPSGGTTASTVLVYQGNTPISNSAIVAIGSDGKIAVKVQTTTDLILDVQGYYTSGNGSVAAGGYVPLTQTRVADTRTGQDVAKAPLAAGSTTTFQITGLGGVPTNAQAVFLNLTVVNTDTSSGYLTTYAADDPRPATSLNYPSGSAAYAIGTQVGLSGAGAIKIYAYGSSAVNLAIDVEGYFTPGSTNGSFTPAATRAYDSRIAPHTAIGPNSAATIPVAGVNGIPLIGSGISSVATNVQVIDSGSAGGYLRVWPSGTGEPGGASDVNFSQNIRSNLITAKLGADGAIQVRNVGGDTVDVVVDLQGWYANAQAAIPNGQDRTQRYVTVQGNASAGGGGWVTHQYRVGSTAAFAAVPLTDLNPAPGGWPEQSTGTFAPHTWDLQATLGNANALVQVRACYGTSATDAAPACSVPSNVVYSPASFADNDASSDVGPGSLALLTGDYQISMSDAAVSSSIGGLAVGRVLTTAVPPGERTSADGIFGPGWTASLRGPDSGNGDLRVSDQSNQGYLVFTAADGSTSTFQATTPVSAYPITFAAVGDAASDGEVVTKLDADTIRMFDADMSATTWTKASGTWQVVSVAQAGSAATSTYSYSAAGLVTRILAPVPAGVTCSAAPDTTAGCRSLVLTYGTVSAAGATMIRLQNVQLSDPQVTGSPHVVTVAAYDYDAAGRLADAYDPRVAPSLKTAYTYTAQNRLATLTPPGLAAWSFGYDASGRLVSVSRPDVANSGTATSSVAYGVPLSGSGAPVALDAANAGTWGETADLPVTGTAVFRPDHVPGASPGSGDWPYATLHYLDVNGREVNTAQYGAGQWLVSTTQYDGAGNEAWSLTPGNRAQALTPTPFTDAYVAGQPSNVVRAGLLSSTTAYNPLDSSQATDTYGPTHPVRLSSGTTVHGRTHVATTYDEGAPNGDVNPSTGAAFGLPTTVVTDTYDVQAASDAGSSDAQVTHTGYAAVVAGDADGWTLGVATTSTVQVGIVPSPADLVTATRHDVSGRVIEQRLPGDATGTTPRTTRTTYYSANGTGSCVSAVSAGLVCTRAPAVQPSTGSPLATTGYTYDEYGDELTKTETFGSSGVVRTTTMTYDAGGRVHSSTLAVTLSVAGGAAVPAVTYAYDAGTGLPTTTAAGTQSVTTAYDLLGREVRYTDATGSVSTTNYDIDGRPASVSDGIGTSTYTYDSASEHRGVVTAENIGAAGQPSGFTAAYDSSGQLASQTYPSGVTATRSYDNVGNATSLEYAKGGTSWMRFSASFGPGDRTVTQSSPQSAQRFGYDGAGRLTRVADTYQGSCTSRSYAFDLHSNRTSLTNAAGGTDCSATTNPVVTNSSFDQADRITNAGYTYDALGRTSAVPTTDATGLGSHASISGALSLGYYANDMVASQSQAAASMGFTLDPLQNRFATFTDGATTTTNHYSNSSDSPTSIAVGTSTWRNVTGPDGNLAAVVASNGTVLLQLTNLHGDLVATAADDPNATGTASYSESTEYGLARSATSAPTTYGWLGGKQRSTNSLGGLTLMGVRLYNPATGRFTSTDPIPGGNDNAYVYPNDPTGAGDLSGRMKWSWGWVSGTLYFNKHETNLFAWGLTASAQLIAAVPYPWKAFVGAVFWYLGNEAGWALANNKCVKIKSYGSVQTYRGGYCK